jgi:type VI protein secretion system component VasK
MHPLTLLDTTMERLTTMHREVQLLNYALVAAAILATGEHAQARAAVNYDDLATVDTKRVAFDTRMALELAASETRQFAATIVGGLDVIEKRSADLSALPRA